MLSYNVNAAAAAAQFASGISVYNSNPIVPFVPYLQQQPETEETMFSHGGVTCDSDADGDTSPVMPVSLSVITVFVLM